jgi:polar amino acid transport system substrate-binding protein
MRRMRAPISLSTALSRRLAAALRIQDPPGFFTIVKIACGSTVSVIDIFIMVKTWPVKARRHDTGRRSSEQGETIMDRRTFLTMAAGAAMLSGLSPAQAQAVLKVGSTPTGVPFTFLDTKTNTIQGIMVDLIQEIAKEAGIKVEVEGMQFSTLIPSLTGNKIDIIAAAMYITAPRKEVIDFSDPIYTYGEGLIVPKSDTKDYKTLADLKGMTVGAQVGTAYVEPLQKSGLFPEVKIYKTIPDILADVNAGRIQAGFADLPIAAYNLQQGLFPQARLVRSYASTITGSVGIGVRKSDGELLKKINAALAKLKADGRLDKILGKWGLV